MRAAIARRMQECRLELHPEKTKIVYCKDDDRRGRYAQEKFDFLGYTFRPRSSKSWKGQYFINFSPDISEKASKAIRREIRRWKLPLRSDKSLEDLSRMFNPILRGWVNYFAVGHSTKCFSLIKDWVEKKVRRHLAHAQKRKGFGWERWNRRWLYDTLKLFNAYRVRRDGPKVVPAG